MRASRRWLFLVALLVAVSLSGTVSLPYYSLGPGPARAVQPLIRFDERERFESTGSFVLTSVSFRQLTAFGLVRAWLDPDLRIVEREALFTSGETDAAERRRSISEMDQSKLDAASVVLRELVGYPRTHGDGVLVESVVEGCAAEGELYVGDVIRAINGRPIGDVGDARRAIQRADVGEALRFDVTVDGEGESVSLVRAPCGEDREPLVGISMIASFPFPLTISSGAIGGPSAGLAWALGLYDLLTPGDLTGGRTIAVTGAIGPDGTVFPIGGIEEKVAAASALDAAILMLPRENLGAARELGEDDVRLVAVGSFDDALDALRENV